MIVPAGTTVPGCRRLRVGTTVPAGTTELLVQPGRAGLARLIARVRKVAPVHRIERGYRRLRAGTTVPVGRIAPGYQKSLLARPA